MSRGGSRDLSRGRNSIRNTEYNYYFSQGTM